MNRVPFTLISDRQLTHACPWCAGMFPGRAALDEHWAESPHCGKNRNVNSQTNSKDQYWGQKEWDPEKEDT